MDDVEDVDDDGEYSQLGRQPPRLIAFARKIQYHFDMSPKIILKLYSERRYSAVLTVPA